MDKEMLEQIKARYYDSLLNDGFFNDTLTITSKDYLLIIDELEKRLNNER